MNQRIFKMGITALTLVAITTSVMAPAAEAGRRRGGRHKGQAECGSRNRQSDYGSGYGRGRDRGRGRTVEIRRGGDTGAVLAGIIGGIALGSALSRASDCEPDYAYVDPYCGERFASLDAYRANFRHHRHPRVIRVIEVDSGRCVNSYRYNQGRWCDAEEWDEDYED